MTLTRKGQDRDKTGTRQGQVREMTGTSQGQVRQGKDRDKIREVKKVGGCKGAGVMGCGGR